MWSYEVQNYVAEEPPELRDQVGKLLIRIQPLWNKKEFREAENLFHEYYEIMRKYEETLPEGRRLHKGTPLHNWGISILLQNDPVRMTEGLRKIFLAYIEDLADFDTIEEVRSAPACRTLYSAQFSIEALRLAELRVAELRIAGRIPRDPEEIIIDTREPLRRIDTNKRKTVFVVHGRNTKARDSMYAFLRAIGLNPINLPEAMLSSKKVTPYIGEMVDFAFSLAQAIVVLMTPDDVGYLQKQFRKSGDLDHDIRPTPQARLNVIFEAGLAMGSARDRTILVKLGQL